MTRTSGRDGWEDGVIVTYTASGTTYVQQQPVANMVAQDCFAEPEPWNGM
jgi:hypothetical protein